MKVFNLVFVILFVLFAALQYNDPDPFLWIPVYLYGAFICWMGYKGRMNFLALFAGLAAFTLYAVYLFFAEDGVLSWIVEHNAENIAGSMKAETPWIEDAREFFGLIILITVFLINYFYYRKRSANK